MNRSLLLNMRDVAWRLAIPSLIFAGVVGLASWSWVAAAITWPVTFVFLAAGFAALLWAIRRQHDREQAASQERGAP
jgi:membrane protein implicated in regulation of membrane protease activity